MATAAEGSPANGRRRGLPQLARVLVVWVIAAAALMLLSALLGGLDFSDFKGDLAGAALIGLINALVWPESRPCSRSATMTSGTATQEPVVAAEAMHAHFRRWLGEFGHGADRDAPAAVSSAP